MPRFLSNLWKSLTSSAVPRPGNSQVSEFAFQDKPWQLPDGLKELRVEKLLDSERHTLLLRGFDVDLTADQTTYSDDPKSIAWSSGALRWAATYHGLTAEETAPVRLHRENLLLVSDRLFKLSPAQIESIISDWLGWLNWPLDRSLQYQKASSAHPVEDGYFCCLRAVTDKAAAQNPAEERVVWSPFGSAGPLTEVLMAFAGEELDRREDVERHICSYYEDIPCEELTHPAFALMEYPCFDGKAILEFGGSVWSSDELRFWSRAGYLHK